MNYFFSRATLLVLSLTFGVVEALAAETNPLEAYKQQDANANAAPSTTTTTTTTTNTEATSAELAEFTKMVPEHVLVQNQGAYSESNSAASKKNGRLTERPLTYEESQQVMLNSVPKTNVQQSPGSHEAFNALLQQNMPLSPTQVVELRQQIDVSQRAAAVPPVVPPKPVSTTVMMNLAPGTTPPAIRLAQGYVSSLVFVDSTGAPWPISSFDVGNPKAVNIQWDSKSNILLLQGVSAYSNGDIVVRLAGLPTPVTLELIAGQRVVDYRVDIHVPGIGPETKDLPVGNALPSSASQVLLNVLDGIAPPGSKLLNVKGADCQAWQTGDTLYLRTRLTVLSPGWMGKMVSPDGMQAYELPKTSSVLVSRFGEPAELKIEGF